MPRQSMAAVVVGDAIDIGAEVMPAYNDKLLSTRSY